MFDADLVVDSLLHAIWGLDGCLSDGVKAASPGQLLPVFKPVELFLLHQQWTPPLPQHQGGFQPTAHRPSHKGVGEPARPLGPWPRPLQVEDRK